MMEYLEVRNLKKYQHYKGRDITAWIKVTCNILDDPDLSEISDVDRWRWVGIIILATKNKNKIPLNSDWISSRISTSNKKPMSVTIDKFIQLGWLKVYKRYRQSIDKVYPKLEGIDMDRKDMDIRGENTHIFWEYFLQKTKKTFKLTADNQTLIAQKLKEGYSVAQLKQAVDSFVTDNWEGRAEHLDLVYCIGKQKGKPDNLEKWLNKESESDFDKKWRKKE